MIPFFVKTIKPLEIMEYIEKIRSVTDSNYIDVLVSEASSIYTTEKQLAWIRNEAIARKIDLNNEDFWFHEPFETYNN